MDIQTERTTQRSFFVRYAWLCGLILLHVPLVIFEFRRLWQLEHYQFFPFALAAFGGLFYQRALKDSFCWRWQNLVLIFADIALLAGGFYLNSSFLAYTGLLLLLFAICRSVADSHANRSLGYLILLPLITLRLPMSTDLDAIHWLQRVTTSVASQVLNFFGFLHVRAGNVLEFPGKRFLVEEACSGVQSLFTVLFLAAVIACGYRRKFFHALLLLASAACFAGVMNVIRVSSIAVAWSEFQLDLSSGWQHDVIGYMALCCAAVLVYSADAAICFVCSPVPDFQGAGVNAVYWNPLTYIWNRVFLVLPRQLKTLSASQQTPGQRKSVPTSGYADDVNAREFPGFRDLIRPGNAITWVWGFIEAWFVSRPYPQLLFALPFMLVGIGGIFFVSWLRSAPRDTLVTQYEAAATAALQADDADIAGVFLKGLIELRPLDHRYRFQLAQHQLEHDQQAAAFSNLAVLTGPDGYSLARLWMISQATKPNPVIPMTTEQIEGQLRAILDREPANATANQMMANQSVRNGQYKLAEGYLLRAVEQHPQLRLPLVKIQKLLNRDEKLVDQQLHIAESESLSRLMKNPTDEKARVNHSETLLMRNQFHDAERVLKEGLAISESLTLQHALASLYSRLATDRMRESTLNSEHSQRLIAQAILLNPQDTNYLKQALALTATGASFESQQLQPAIDALVDTENLTTEQQVLLAQVKATHGDFDGAIEQTEPLIESRPRLRILLAGFLHSAGRIKEADVLLQQMEAEYQVNGTMTELESICDHAEALLMTRKFEAAAMLLTTVFSDSERNTEHLVRRNILSARANLALFDERLKAEAFSTTEGLIELLDAALTTDQLALAVIERLAGLSCSDSDLSKVADDRLAQLLVAGNANADVYNLVGSRALSSNDTVKAKRYLERAYSLAPQNPMVLNNLALAVIRARSSDASKSANGDRALKLANDALKVVPEHPDVLSTRGEILIAQERFEEARRDLEIALPKRQKSSNIRRLLVEVFNALGEHSIAEEHDRVLRKLNDQETANG